jgi:hypothetical protein
MTTIYVSQWEVPSNSDPTKTYKVSLTEDGTYQCSCMAWTRHMPRRDCSHITQVKANPELYEKGAPKVYPEIVLANVDEVKQMPDNKLYTPLIPVGGNPMIVATVMYDLLKFGVPWGVIKERYGKMISRSDGSPPSKDTIIANVTQYGRVIVDREKSSFMDTAYKIVWEGRTL